MVPSIAPLRNVAALTALVERVKERTLGLPGMATFYGPSGWGKTSAVTFAANEYQAYCVEVKSCWTASDFLQACMTEMGLTPVRRIAHMVDQVGSHLAVTDRPFIVDDAQYLLKRNAIELVRDIYESCQTTVILVGEENLPQDLTRWENIHNRQLAWEPALACNVSDARELASIYARSITVHEDLLQAIVEASGGSIRRVATNLATAQEAARRAGRKDADRAFWGDRAFATGQPPVRRKLPGQSASSIVPIERRARA